MKLLVSPKRRVAAALTGLLAAALLVVPFAGTANAQEDDSGRVRVMHASPDAPAVDIFVDGQKAVTALEFPDNTPYVALSEGAHNVKVFPSPSDGSGTPVLEANLDVAAGEDYTVLAVGQLSAGTIELLPLQDNNATPAAGQAHVRLIHVSPDAPAVDVVVAGTDTKVFSDIAFKDASEYTPVPAGTYDLEVKAAGTDTTALALDGVALADQTVYTVVAVGLLSDGSLTAVPLVDAEPQAAGEQSTEQQQAAPAAPATGTGLAASEDGTNLMLLGALIALVGAGSLAAFGYARAR